MGTSTRSCRPAPGGSLRAARPLCAPRCTPRCAQPSRPRPTWSPRPHGASGEAVLDLRRGPFLVLRGGRRPGPRGPPGVKNRRCVVHEEHVCSGRALAPPRRLSGLHCCHQSVVHKGLGGLEAHRPALVSQAFRDDCPPSPSQAVSGTVSPSLAAPQHGWARARVVDHRSLTRRPEGESRGPGGRGASRGARGNHLSSHPCPLCFCFLGAHFCPQLITVDETMHKTTLQGTRVDLLAAGQFPQVSGLL